MLAKSWKKILFVILIIACLWNIISKVVRAQSFKEVSEKYQTEQEQNVNTNKVDEKKN